MNIPKLAKKPITKSCHGVSWKDDYAWVHQDNILEVLKDGSKLLSEVRKYLEDENNFTEKSLYDTKSLQKKLFKEIKGRIKLDDESLPFKDKKYEYWTKVTKEGDYSKKLRKKIGSDKVEIYWDGDIEAKGKKFDPNLHQAMTEIEDDKSEAGIIIQEIQPGYMLGDRLLRPALVGVSKKKKSKSEEKDNKNEKK